MAKRLIVFSVDAMVCEDVMGLPVLRLSRMLGQFGVRFFD